MKYNSKRPRDLEKHSQMGVYMPVKLRKYIQSAMDQTDHLSASSIMRDGAYMYLKSMGFEPPADTIDRRRKPNVAP